MLPHLLRPALHRTSPYHSLPPSHPPSHLHHRPHPLAGTVLVASAFSVAQLVVGRLVLGVGVGLATQATPLYLSEMAPYNLRGALNILFQLAVTIGE